MDARSTGRSSAAPERVWAVLSDIDAWPGWVPTVTSVERLPGASGGASGGAHTGEGSVFALVQPRLGRATWQVTEWQPGRGFTWVSRRPGVRTTGTHRLRPDGGGTAIELGIVWDGPGAWLTRLFFRRMTQRYVETEMAALVAATESRGAR